MGTTLMIVTSDQVSPIVWAVRFHFRELYGLEIIWLRADENWIQPRVTENNIIARARAWGD